MKLTIVHLSKQYRRDFWGLRYFYLVVGPGVTGLLGPNGAGKSTLMRMLATITQPSEGTIQSNGVDIVRSPDTLRATLGYLPQDFGIYPHLSEREFLKYFAAIKGLDGKAARRRVEDVRVEIGVGSPLLVVVKISGTCLGLCSQPAEIKQTNDEKTFDIHLLATPDGPACPPDHQRLSFGIDIPLNLVEKQVGIYTVSVNGKETSFDWNGAHVKVKLNKIEVP